MAQFTNITIRGRSYQNLIDIRIESLYIYITFPSDEVFADMSFSDDRKKIIALDEYCNVKELDLENKTINTIVSKESLIELDALRKKSGQQYVEHER